MITFLPVGEAAGGFDGAGSPRGSSTSFASGTIVCRKCSRVCATAPAWVSRIAHTAGGCSRNHLDVSPAASAIHRPRISLLVELLELHVVKRAQHRMRQRVREDLRVAAHAIVHRRAELAGIARKDRGEAVLAALAKPADQFR